MILAILQARMSSSRLPGKVLMPLAGAPMMVRQIERIARSRRIDRIVVATSANPGDDVIEKTARREGIDVHRGPLDDVLARFLGAVAAYPAETVVRLTADCPFADPDVIEHTFVNDGTPVVKAEVVSQSQLLVTLAAPSTATTISWRGHSFDGPWITNDNGVGALAFFEFPITGP